MKKFIVITALGIVTALAPMASAQSPDATGNMDVMAFVSTECWVEDVGELYFGDYSPFDGGSPFAEATFTVTCTKGTNVKVGLSTALKLTGQFANTPETLNYELCSADASLGCDHPWDDDANQVEIASTAGIPGNQLTVYGRVPGGQNVRNDLYEDTVAINVWVQ